MHPKVKEAYTKAGFQVPANPADTNEDAFRRKTKRARDEDVKTLVTQVWRISSGTKKDFIFYEKQEIIPDLAGNEDALTTYEGRYEMPKFRNVYNNQTGDIESVSLAGYETIYDIPYSAEKMEEILNSGDSSNCAFTLAIGMRKYGGFSADDFINKSFDELSQIALYGGIQTVRPSELRANDGAELRAQRNEAFDEQEKEAAEEAKKKLAQIRESTKRAFEQAKKDQEEEAKKRQEAVDQQSDKRVVRTEAIASFDKEAPAAAVADDNESEQQQQQQNGEINVKTSGARPEVEAINEEVVFVLGKPEDQDINEDEEIAKQFKEQEATTKQTKSQKKQKSKQQEEEE